MNVTPQGTNPEKRPTEHERFSIWDLVEDGPKLLGIDDCCCCPFFTLGISAFGMLSALILWLP